MVPGIFKELSGRDCNDLARSRMFESAGREHRRDFPFEARSLPRQLGQLRRTESRTRRTATRRLQESTERNRVAPVIRRSIPGQGEQSVASAEQVETDRSDGKDRG